MIRIYDFWRRSRDFSLTVLRPPSFLCKKLPYLPSTDLTGIDLRSANIKNYPVCICGETFHNEAMCRICGKKKNNKKNSILGKHYRTIDLCVVFFKYHEKALCLSSCSSLRFVYGVINRNAISAPTPLISRMCCYC